MIDPRRGVVCPHCDFAEAQSLGKGQNKKIQLSLLVQPEWLFGGSGRDEHDRLFGGSAQDDLASSARWNSNRALHSRLLEVRGDLPDEVTCPETGVRFSTKRGAVPSRSKYVCATCGTVQNVLTTVKMTRKTAPVAAYAIQGYAPRLANSSSAYKGKFFAPFDETLAAQFNAAAEEWEERKTGDLGGYWPTSSIPFGFMTGMANGDIRTGHGFTHWWTMFNPRELLVLAQLLKSIVTVGVYSWDAREYVLGAFQQYLRNHNMFSFWNIQSDKLEPFLSNDNYHPKSTVVENSVFPELGRGNWRSCFEGILAGRVWALNPWDPVAKTWLEILNHDLFEKVDGKSLKVHASDVLGSGLICQGSATDLSDHYSETLDLIITDPPFGGLVHYSELADFFYVWLRLGLKERYPEIFEAEVTPKALEVVANRAREPEDPDGFYQRLLTQSWVEAHRILKSGGILAFTFHHSEDAPWVSVLESLFDAGFYLEATYPIRSDETKGDGEFGSKTIEYDIIHVCRKRTEDPTPVSWARMRREVLADVRQLQSMLENHAKNGLPAADLQVIRRGKALEYYSRHYGKVYVDEGRTMSVKEAIVGINQLIDEDFAETMNLLPANAEPITRQFLRIFENNTEIPRDQMQKFLRGSGIAPDEFVNRGWCVEKNKTFFLVDPLDYAKAWHGRFRRNLASDFDQSWFLVGACFDGSGINALETLKNENFTPHPALRAILEWYSQLGYSQLVRTAARRAVSIYDGWASSNHKRVEQLNLFFNEV